MQMKACFLEIVSRQRPLTIPYSFTEGGIMHRVLSIAVILSGWAILCQDASAQNLDQRSTPPIQAIPTVEDAPQGITEGVGSIGRIVNTPSSNPHFLSQPDFSSSLFQFSVLHESYTSYSTLTFETPITPDHVKLRVTFEPYREGGNFGLGLPLE